MSNLGADFALLLEEKLELCDLVGIVREMNPLHGAWDGSLVNGDLADDMTFLRNFYLDVFLPPREATRAKRGVLAVGRFFRELAKAHYEVTGEPVRFPAALVEELERRVLTAMYPTAYDIVMGAKLHPANQVADNLRRLGATEEQWRKKF